ncbi:MAG: hypothetical protein JNM24_03770 [Bdellovibrionaceae bacterium]|nr:hypothetical protein [Pseudobdellovibrionaceae bacterium]
MVTRLKTLFLIVTVVGSVSYGQTQMESSISKFELDSCNSKIGKCISVRADKAESGSTTPNMLLKNVSVTITNTKTKKEDVYSKLTGFYDIKNQRIIISEYTKEKVLKETVFLIAEVNVRHMEMK